MPDNSTDDSSGEFLGHMLKSQRALRNYLFSLHPRDHDIDDLMQETARTLWKEFDKFDRTREFLPWALRVGYFEVLRFRKKQSRDRLVFSEELMELLAQEAPPGAREDGARIALGLCLAKLDPRSREVLMARYGRDASVADLASRLNASVHSLYRLLDRSRASVATCVRRHLHLEEEPFKP